MLNKLLLAFGVLLCVAGALSFFGFTYMARQASGEAHRLHLPDEAVNAIKHGFAAAEATAVTSLITDRETAFDVVMSLGIANEWVERYVKRSTDWPSEVYKDLHNNIYGIVGAQWLEQRLGVRDGAARLRLMGWLAATRALAWTEEDPRIPALPNRIHTAAAIRQMRDDQDKLAREVLALLDERSAEVEHALRD